MNMRSNRYVRNRPIAEINIVPYVDVMLVLLVIFMITAPVIMQGVQVNLPTANAKSIVPEGAVPVIVSIDEKGEIYLNIAEHPRQAITPMALQTEVAAAKSIDPDRLVSIKADKSISYDTVLKVMVLLQQAGVTQIGLESQYAPVD